MCKELGGQACRWPFYLCALQGLDASGCRDRDFGKDAPCAGSTCISFTRSLTGSTHSHTAYSVAARLFLCTQTLGMSSQATACLPGVYTSCYVLHQYAACPDTHAIPS